MNSSKSVLFLDRCEPFTSCENRQSQEESDSVRRVQACQASHETLRRYVQQLGVLGKRKQSRCISQELARLSVK